MQVVAAIKGVTSGTYLKAIKEYEAQPIKPEHEYLRRTLADMTIRYEAAQAKVENLKDGDMLDFHARRLVEIAGNIVLGYLLLGDAQRDERFTRSATIFIVKADSENRQKESYIQHFDPRQLGLYKATLEG